MQMASRGGRSRLPAADSNEQAPEASNEMCVYCFDTLMSHYTREPVPPPQFADATCPLFVTWTKLSPDGEGRLRGCIGSLSPLTIHAGLSDYALTSSLRDRRFNPITAAEVPSLEVTVSLLTNYEQGADCYDWKVGVHGIIIDFVDPQGTARSATYLPEIAEREGWSIEETIKSLVRKSGFAGSITKDLLRGISLVRYQSSLCSMTYQEYAAGVEKRGGAQQHAGAASGAAVVAAAGAAT